MKVEDLSQFGKPLGMPKKAQRKMLGIVLTALREKSDSCRETTREARSRSLGLGR